MSVKSETLKKYFIQLRRIQEHREKNSERNIRRIYKELLKELQSFLGVKYAQLAEDDKLDYSILQGKGEYVRFLEEVEMHINSLSPQLSQEIKNVVEGVYKSCYDGMVKGVARSANRDDLRETFKAVNAATPDVVKRAVENPISGLTLNDTLEKHRKDIIYNIKQNIGVGLTNGDRMSTMARRISKSLNDDYTKAVRIARTEVHRVREAGFHDAAESVDKGLKQGNANLKMVKIWRTVKDERVRYKKANHRKMEGQTVGIDEYFDLGGGVKTKAPGQSGDAKNDINCRCFLEYDLVESVDKSAESGIIKKKDLSKYIGKEIVRTDNQSIREWYVANVSDIPNQVDKTKSFEEQVQQAYNLRIKYKHEARVAMSDKETAEKLEKNRPVKTFEELLQDKISRKKLSKQEALEDILKTASKTNADVNKKFDL